MPYTYLSLKTDLDDVTAAAAMDLTNRSNSCAVAVGNLIGSGARRRFLKVTQGEVDATGLVTISSTGPTNTQVLTIAGVAITAVTSGATGNQVNIDASPTVVAASLAALLNSSSSFTGILTATSALGVVTITARAGSGKLGNKIAMVVTSWSNTAVSGAVLGTGTGAVAGVNGTTTDVPLGLAE